MERDRLLEYLEDFWPEVWRTTKYIFTNPELGGQEFKAVEAQGALLSKYNFNIEYGYLGIDTAFKATLGKGRPIIYLLTEYDALPEIGHGCGHHLIAGASIAAALALAAVKEGWTGTLVVLGTPAEETQGGKIQLANEGAFAQCDVVLMFHPGQSNIINITSHALEALEVTFLGKGGHGVRGEKGNPLVSLVKLYQDTLSFNKKHFFEQQIEGVITSGGVTPNLIPRKAVGKFYLRAKTTKGIKKTINDFCNMACKAANSNGTEVVINTFENRYLPLKTNFKLASIFSQAAQTLGQEMDTTNYQIIGAMDLGNVSWQVPAIHPYLKVGNGQFAAHSREFAKITGAQEGEKVMKLASGALALTAFRLFKEPQLLKEIWQEHRNDVRVFWES